MRKVAFIMAPSRLGFAAPVFAALLAQGRLAAAADAAKPSGADAPRPASEGESK